MKKIFFSLFLGLIFTTSCHRSTVLDGSTAAQINNAAVPVSAVVQDEGVMTKKYSDWDRALRADTDLQNMYVSTPRKIEKPIDIYMAMALAVKYNYSRRMVSYEQSVLDASASPLNKIPDILQNAGYINTNNAADVNSDLKVTWNILDLSTVYYQNMDIEYKSNVAFELERKVIQNLLQETRSLYWKALTAQRLLPVTDDMIEYMILEVDELNAKARDLASSGLDLSAADLLKKREYMDAVKKLSDLKREMETAETKLAGLLGFHPSTEFKLAGDEYHNFELPTLRASSVEQLEWLAITNRPELRVYDIAATTDDLKVYAKAYKKPSKQAYMKNPGYYNRMWSKKGRELGLSVLEDRKAPNPKDMKTLRRQRMTGLVLSQVYVAWANYMSALEDYQIAQEIADTSENIAEITVIKGGVKAIKSHLEASRAIEDELKASLAYADMQDALSNMYSTIGLDALPYYMLAEKPSKIAVYLRLVLEKWNKGMFIPDNRPYLMNIPSKRPPVNLSSYKLLPDIEVETGERIKVTIPQEIIEKMNAFGKITTKAGMVNDKPLPKWLKYDASTMTLGGVAMSSDVGEYIIKIYLTDEQGMVAYVTFGIKIVPVFVPSISVEGLTDGRKAQVFKRCQGQGCVDDYVTGSQLGNEVEVSPQGY